MGSNVSITVYIWDLRKTDGLAGHAAIELSDGTYISWWPKGGVKNSRNGKLDGNAPLARNRTLQDDIADEGCQPKRYQIKLTKEQEDKIKEWFEVFKKCTTKYNLYSMNCSTVAYLALCQAFPELKNHLLSSITVWMPFMIEIIAAAYAGTKVKTLKLSDITKIKNNIDAKSRNLTPLGGPTTGFWGWVASWF